MSNIVKFFAAARADALGALDSGPNTLVPVATFGNFDAEEALLDWEAHLTGRTFESLVEDDIPDVVAEGSEGGPIVLSLSDDLMDALTTASSSQIDDLSRWWAGEKADGGTEISPSVASEILQELTGLIRQARDSGEGVYCWMS